jgi:hypothetical protein
LPLFLLEKYLRRSPTIGVESGLAARGRATRHSLPSSWEAQVRADTSDVAFRLLLALGDLWEGLHRVSIDPGSRGLHLTKEYLGGYTRYSAGPGSHPRIMFEWNESSRHLRVIRCDEWHGFDATISSTVAYVRAEARARGLADTVDAVFLRACQEPAPSRRTVVAHAALAAAANVALRKGA